MAMECRLAVKDLFGEKVLGRFMALSEDDPDADGIQRHKPILTAEHLRENYNRTLSDKVPNPAGQKHNRSGIGQNK